MVVDIGRIVRETGASLEREAAMQFGAAVEDFARGTLGAVFGNENTAVDNKRDPNAPPSRPQGAIFVPTSYAAALAGGTSYRPKLKFLFKVEFIFTPEAVREFPDLFGGAGANDFTFMVKAVDRPKIDFEYDEVNMYNFRTKVLKKIRHRELTITFYDDAGNRVINFFRGLMMLNSPITRRQLIREGTTTPPDPNSLQHGSGMVFTQGMRNITTADNAIRGVVNSTVGNIISTIRIKQMYFDSSETLGAASKEVIYDFLNARIVSFDLDDLTHEQSEASTMIMQFDYDWMEIVGSGPLSKMDGPTYAVAVPGSTAPIDMSPQRAATNGASTALNPFANIIIGGLERATRSITSELVNKTVSKVLGDGIFGQIVGSQASNAITGIVGSATRDIATGASQVIMNGMGAVFNSGMGMVKDSAEGIRQAVSAKSSNDDPLGDFIVNLGL